MHEFGNILTVDEVADRLRVSRAWLSKARREGVFAPEIKLGGRVVFRETDLQAWLVDQTFRPQAA